MRGRRATRARRTGSAAATRSAISAKPGRGPRRSQAPAIPPAGGGEPGAQETSWDLVPVLFGTDREEQPDPKRLQYNAERGRRLELGAGAW